MIMPTAKQMGRCAMMGWAYIGDGLFTRGDQIGYFTAEGFVKE